MQNQKNEYMLRALTIADKIMNLSNDAAALADEGSLGILFGVMRDCAYKIRQHVESEASKLKTSMK